MGLNDPKDAGDTCESHVTECGVMFICRNTNKTVVAWNWCSFACDNITRSHWQLTRHEDNRIDCCQFRGITSAGHEAPLSRTLYAWRTVDLIGKWDTVHGNAILVSTKIFFVSYIKFV